MRVFSCPCACFSCPPASIPVVGVKFVTESVNISTVDCSDVTRNPVPKTNSETDAPQVLTTTTNPHPTDSILPILSYLQITIEAGGGTVAFIKVLVLTYYC